MVTVNDPVEVLPLKSAAVQVTVVVPVGKKLPEAGTQVTSGAGSTTSAAVAPKVTAAPVVDVALISASDGTSRVGGTVSWTFMVNVPSAMPSQASRAVQVTVAVPRGNVEPERGEQVTVGSSSVTGAKTTVMLKLLAAALESWLVWMESRAVTRQYQFPGGKDLVQVVADCQPEV